MKLFMIHVGFYDPALGEGIYEFHTNYFVVASDPKSAKKELMSRAVSYTHLTLPTN